MRAGQRSSGKRVPCRFLTGHRKPVFYSTCAKPWSMAVLPVGASGGRKERIRPTQLTNHGIHRNPAFSFEFCRGVRTWRSKPLPGNFRRHDVRPVQERLPLVPCGRHVRQAGVLRAPSARGGGPRSRRAERFRGHGRAKHAGPSRWAPSPHRSREPRAVSGEPTTVLQSVWMLLDNLYTDDSNGRIRLLPPVTARVTNSQPNSSHSAAAVASTWTTSMFGSNS